MRSFVSKLLITCLLAASSSLALGPPAPPPGFGQPPPGHVDSLASGHWSPTPPGVRASKWQPPSWGPPPGAGVGAGNWLPPPPGSAMPGAPGGPPVSQEPSTVKTVGQSELQLEQGFPGEPTRASMYTYVPTTFQKGNPLVVALHHCGGTATGYFRENPDWVKMADQKGFMMVFASSPGGTGGCWDVSSKSSLKHNGGGDSQSIANMITYAQKKYGCSKQVYVVGHSSGAMLTQVMGATYPDLILAGAAYSGVPAGCLRTEKAQGADWNSTCTGGSLDESPAYWGQQAKDMYPGWKGSRPRMMLIHGNRDTVINFNDHREATKQWCNLHNLDPETPTKQYKLSSQPNYEVSLYGSSVMAVAADGVTHDNPAKVDVTCDFWGL